MDISIIKQKILDFQATPIIEVQPRDVSIPLNTKKIITVVGPRRAGKTSELMNLMRQLIESGVDKQRIFYLSCEDERFQYTAQELGDCLSAYQGLYPDLDMASCYFFFDEIQLFDKWDRFIRRIYDTVTKNIFITGSNAKLLSTEIATELRGRALSYSVLPLSYVEYCRFQGVDSLSRSGKSMARLSHLMDSYLENGGFPELIKFDHELRVKALQEYFNVMFYRDLIERFKISNTSLLKFFIKRLMSSATKEFSIHKIYNDLKSSGYKISKDSLYSFADYCESIYLAIPLKKFSASIIHQELSEKKIYVIDNGLFNAMNPKFSPNKGKLMEQAVFHKLLSEGHEIYFHKQKYECDFLIKSGFNIIKAIQVTLSMADSETRIREIRGLVEACHANQLTEGLIVTEKEAESFEYDGVSINCMPLIEFL